MIVHGHKSLNFTSMSKKFRLWCLLFIPHWIHSNVLTIKITHENMIDKKRLF